MRKRFVRSYLVLVILLVTLVLGTGLPVFAADAFPGQPPLTPAEVDSAAVNAGFTIKVNTLVDEWSTDTATMAQSKCSLREALQATVTNNPQGNQGCGAASIGNFSEFTLDLIPGTYLLTRSDQLPNIAKKIVIDGKNTVTINGGGNNGRTEGIFIVASGELNLIKLKLQYGRRPFGGAIWIKGGGSAQAAEVEFYRNLADNGPTTGDGGAVAVDVGSFICIKSKFRENTARNAGGAISSGGVQVLIDRCEFFNNHAELNGGAYAGFGGSETTHPIIRDSKFRENWVYRTTVPATWPNQYQFTDDASGGGALYNKGYMEIERTEFFKNYTQRSKGGGAIYNQGDLRLLDVAISDNKARPDTPVPNTLGGAILNDSTLIMMRTSLHTNEASFGGAIMNRTGGQLYLVNSTVADNLAKTGGGIENGFNFLFNGNPMTNNGGQVNVWLSTIARANDNNADSANVGNIGNGYFYMANSVTDSVCAGTISSHGGNIFKTACQRVPGDFNNDQTGTDVIAQNVGQIGLEGLANNGGVNLPDAEFLSIKVSGSSPAIDLALNDYCTDPALQGFLVTKDQIQGQRPNGPKCDSGALEVGSQPPQWFSDPTDSQGLFFPLTVFGNVPSTTTDLFIQNKGGGAINWSMLIEHNPGGVFSLESGPSSGGLTKDQSATLTFRCTPNALGYHDGMLLITTDLPDQPQIRYPMTCAMREDPQKPFALRDTIPGPISTGTAAPNAQTSAQIHVNNQGANPLGATISWQDVLAQTFEFVATVGPAKAAGPQADVTVPSGSTLTLDITCTPDAPGLFVNTLNIATNDPINPLLSYDVSCEGAPSPNPEPLTPQATYQEGSPQQIMGLALSPDGNQLLAGHWLNNGVAVYSISNPANGLLSLQTTFSQPGMSIVTGIRYPSNGAQVYYSSMGGDGVVAASRDGSGNLTFLQTITTSTIYICNVNPIQFCTPGSMGGARALDISPDDLNLYVTGNADDTLAVLRRNPTSGLLSFSQKFTITIEGANILDGPFGVLVSPDGKNVYVAGRDSDTVVAFRRRNDTGRLEYLSHYKDQTGGVTGLDAPIELAISPDGKFVYVAGQLDDAVQIFQRNPADGYLTPVEAVTVGDGPYHVLVSHDENGERLLVALWPGDEIKVYARDRETGQLAPVAGQATLTMNGPVFMVSTPDDRHVYASLFEGQGVQQLRSLHRVPVGQNLSPASVTAGGGDFTLTVNGSSFYPDSTVLWNGAPLVTTFVSDRRLKATVSSGQIGSAGSANVQVRTPTPGGGDSNTLVLAILAPAAPPIPSVESLEPAEAPYGGEPLGVIVTGSGFTPQSQALLNGAPVQTTYLNETTLLVELTAEEVTAPGPLVITVVNGDAPGGSTLLAAGAATNSMPSKFTVAAPGEPAQAAIASFQPGSFTEGSGDQWLTVLGHNFSALANAPSVAQWNGEARETVVQAENILHVRLTATDLASAGQGVVTIFTPGVPESDPKNFPVLSSGQNPVAHLDSIYPDASLPRRLVISGSDFINGAQVRLNNNPLATTFVNPYVLTAAVTSADLIQGGQVTVQNPATSQSNSLIFAPQIFLYLPGVRR